MIKRKLIDAPSRCAVGISSTQPDFEALALRYLNRASRLNELRYLVTGVERVALGDQVTIYSVAESIRYRVEIVPPSEADPGSKRISGFSPLGAAMLGRRKGESFAVMVLGRHYDFFIMDLVKKVDKLNLARDPSP